MKLLQLLILLLVSGSIYAQQESVLINGTVLDNVR